MRIFVTGGAGFIGSNLIPRLLANGDEVFAADNYFLGKHAYIEPLLANPRFHFHEFDLLELDGVVAMFADVKPGLVWHLAANSDISFGTKYTDFDLKGGTRVTYNILEAMRRTGANAIIFSSSGAVYGEPAVVPTPENYGPMFPISLYAASKLACEGLLTAFSHNYDIRTWMFRFGNIVGPNPTHGVIHDFVLRLKENPRYLRILGDGTQSKPYVHVEDCIDGIMFGYEHAGELVNCYNLAVPDQTSVNEIARWTMEAMGLDPAAVQVEYTGGPRGWRGDVAQVRLDTSRMEALGWKPTMSSADAVRRSIREIVAQLT